MVETQGAKVALVTGGSRGIGAAATLALARRGYDILVAYRNKAARAEDIISQVAQQGQQALAVHCDITRQEDRDQLFATLRTWRGRLDALVLNASGGLEHDLLAADPDYPMHINRDAQVALVDGAQPFMQASSVIVFVTSHWAHLHGRVEHVPAYIPIAVSKHAGEQALRQRQPEFTERGIRLIVVTGDLIAGTITPRLLERSAPGLTEQRRDTIGSTLPTAEDMGEAIARAATDASLASGHTIVIGGTLESLIKH